MISSNNAHIPRSFSQKPDLVELTVSPHLNSWLRAGVDRVAWYNLMGEGMAKDALLLVENELVLQDAINKVFLNDSVKMVRRSQHTIIESKSKHVIPADCSGPSGTTDFM